VYSLPTSADVPYVIAASLIGAVLIVAAIIQLRADKSHRSPQELRKRRRNYFPIALVLGIFAFLCNS
jgi:Flp pilus assembly protein protease CpaA